MTYRVCCHGGPFDGHAFNYVGLPEIIVLMMRPFIYHDYRRVGGTNDYRHIEENSMTVQWFVVTKVFREDGEIIAGPFDTETEARNALPPDSPYLVDSREVD